LSWFQSIGWAAGSPPVPVDIDYTVTVLAISVNKIFG
jgi:hypothetical protein